MSVNVSLIVALVCAASNGWYVWHLLATRERAEQQVTFLKEGYNELMTDYMDALEKYYTLKREVEKNEC